MRNYILLNQLLENVASKVEKQLVVDYLQKLKDKYDTDGTPVSERYILLKDLKLSSNTTVICISCMSIRHRKSDDKCCEKAPNYDVTTSYRKILAKIEEGELVNGKPRSE